MAAIADELALICFIPLTGGNSVQTNNRISAWGGERAGHFMRIFVTYASPAHAGTRR